MKYFELLVVVAVTWTAGTCCDIYAASPADSDQTKLENFKISGNCSSITVWLHGLSKRNAWSEHIPAVFGTYSRPECVVMINYTQCLLNGDTMMYPIFFLGYLRSVSKRIAESDIFSNRTNVTYTCVGFSMGGLICGQISINNRTNGVLFDRIIAGDSPQSIYAPVIGLGYDGLNKNMTSELIVIHTSCSFFGINRETYGHVDIFINNDTKTDSGCVDPNTEFFPQYEGTETVSSNQTTDDNNTIAASAPTSTGTFLWHPQNQSNCDHSIMVMMLIRMSVENATYTLVSGNTTTSLNLTTLESGIDFKNMTIFYGYTQDLGKPDLRTDNTTCSENCACNTIPITSVFIGGILCIVVPCVCIIVLIIYCIAKHCRCRSNEYEGCEYTDAILLEGFMSIGGDLEWKYECGQYIPTVKFNKD